MLIATDPVAWLGVDHVARYGTDPMLLVKLLDAGQRLPVHAHPDAGFAGHHLGRTHGKAEAWYIVDGGTVHLGLAVADRGRGTRPARRRAAHRRVARPAARGSGVGRRRRLRAAGMLHAIGSGIFLVELQEPEDLSILLEWRGFEIDGAELGHLGLGFDIALAAVDRTALSPEGIHELVGPADDGASVLPRAADEYFRLERRVVDGPTRPRPGSPCS